jgi:ketosteroid isomerase-like protein
LDEHGGEVKRGIHRLGLIVFVISFAAVLLAACDGAPKPTSAPAAPTTVLVQPTRTAAPPAATVPAPTSAPIKATTAPRATQPANPSPSAQASYDGDWSGTTNPHDMPVSFTVENNQLTDVNLGYAYHSGDCTVSGNQSQNPNARINGKTFSVQFTDDNGYQYNFTGTFTSNTEANGTLNVKGTSTVCGAFEAKLTWKATTGAASSSDTSSDMSDATPTTGIADTDVVLAFFKAVNANKLDDALALADDQIVFNLAGTPGIGKDALKAYLQDQISRHVTFTVSNLTSNDGITLRFTLQASDQSAPVDGETASIGDSKIQTLVLQ